MGTLERHRLISALTWIWDNIRLAAVLACLVAFLGFFLGFAFSEFWGWIFIGIGSCSLSAVMAYLNIKKSRALPSKEPFRILTGISAIVWFAVMVIAILAIIYIENMIIIRDYRGELINLFRT
jgi:hypothetical protein